MLSHDKLVEKAYHLALRGLSRRDYTRLEISNYLKSKLEIDDDAIEEVLEVLEKQRFVDDGRYAEEKISYLRYQLRGNGWIKNDLMKRGIDEYDIERYLEVEDQEAYIQRGVERSICFLKRTKRGSKQERMNKLKGHLLRQGFEFNVLNSILNQVEDDYDKADELESLKKVMTQSYKRLSRKYEGYELSTKVMQNARSKGYPYQLVKVVMEELDECKD